jgi:hypothetical protein
MCAPRVATNVKRSQANAIANGVFTQARDELSQNYRAREKRLMQPTAPSRCTK